MESLKKKAENIKKYTELILMDIEDFEGIDELFCIDNNFTQIMREADSAIDHVREIADKLDKEG